MNAKRLVFLASSLVLVLAAALTLRLVNAGPWFESRAAEPVTPDAPRWSGDPPRAGVVPEPRTASAADLGFPRWADPGSNTAIRFQSDLDLIAPLGDGPENAALWFADFAVPAGARAADYADARRRAEDAGVRGGLLPDDPLVREAEAWVDQATMRFYPDSWPADGWNTQIPNLLMMLDLAKTWSARANTAGDLETALADYRRAIRLGRLLRQEDAVIISDLVGLAAIRIGLQGMYDRLVRDDEPRRAMVVALALGECAPQRLKTAETITRVDPSRYVSTGWLGADVDVSDDLFRTLSAMAEKDPDRRFRLEAILALNLVRFEGTRRQRRETAALLERLAATDDYWVAELAGWAASTPPDLASRSDMHR
ncbi:MAG TPA: hypothetical protein VD788_13570 [Candidatus Polarisedimenticolaceae bacterium]|nr:hypothetical protein [Candidatus Polarisedimenticolaceae bacterium]